MLQEVDAHLQQAKHNAPKPVAPTPPHTHTLTHRRMWMQMGRWFTQL